MTIEERLKELKADYQDANSEKIRLTTRLDEAKKRRKEAVQKVKDKGYEVKDLPKILKEKEAQLEQALEEAEKYLPAASDDGEEEFDY